MKKTLLVCILCAALVCSLAACGKARPAGNMTPAAEPQATETPVPTAEPTEQPAPVETAQPQPAPAAPARQAGEHFESTIMIEGMEEPVQYEHIRREDLGFEMDYDYERFTRTSEANREIFLSVWDDPENPEDFLELTFLPTDADTAAAFAGEALSRAYDITTVTRTLDRAGDCVRIEGSVIKGTNRMADQLQGVYVIPAPNGCIVATEHYFITEAEGFGKRFSAMLNTLSLLEKSGEGALTDEQALTAVMNYCVAVNPNLEEIVKSGEYPAYWEIESGDAREVVVLFRSYTGALTRYYIDRATGEAYVTEFVPGITAEEERTEESLNVRDYLK